MESDLFKQLEDKKKGCGKVTGKVLGKDHLLLRCGDLSLCKTCKAEIAILEQAIAEMQKQRQEILDKIVNYNQNKLRWLWNDGEIFVALSSIKQQLTTKEEAER